MRTFAEKSKATQQATSLKATVLTRSHFGHSQEVNSILSLQRTIGNQAVQRLLRSNAEERDAVLTGTNSPRLGHDFSRIPVRPPRASGIQTKLAINKPGVEYEHEADRIAEQVMRMPEPKLQRACTCGGACPKCTAEQLSQEGERLKNKLVRASGTEQVAAPPIVHEVLAGPGQPLDRPTRAVMEPRFGHDFSQVRVHTDAKAAKSAQTLNALAYTVGRDVVFGARQYAPASNEGQRLLAHELAHVVQQSNGAGEATIMRWSYGTGAVPDPTYVVVPDDEKPRVEAGMSIVSRVMSNPRNYPRCHKRFQDLCPSPSANELVDRFNAARVWKETSADPRFYYGSSVSPDHIAYTEPTWRIGRWMIANTAIHEFMHRCGHHTEADIDRTAEICGMPEKPY